MNSTNTGEKTRCGSHVALLFALLSSAIAGCGVAVGADYPPEEYPPGAYYDYPPDSYITTAEPVYYEGHASYWYGGRWFYRDGGRWNHYDHEPHGLYDHRVHTPVVRRTYEHSRWHAPARPSSRGGERGGGHHR